MKVLFSATALALLPVTALAAPSDILFILDGSGSMWGQIDNVAKIESAKSTMLKLMDEVPADAHIGLMTYGTQSKNSCQDVSVLNAIGSDRGAIKTSIGALKPLGKTPIEKSLVEGIATLAGKEPADVAKSLVLISDGIETCDGDPCAIAAKASDTGVALKVHVVGFNVDDEARNQLECIAMAGGGRYFDAADTKGFTSAMQAVVEVAQAESAPKPVTEESAGPVVTEFFRDDFDGETLGEVWRVDHASEDNFIVDDGFLTVLSTTFGGFASSEPQNLFTYTGELPKGDWDMEIIYTGEYTTDADRLTMGLRKDEQNYLATGYLGILTGTGCQKTEMRLTKMFKGTADTRNVPFRGTSARGQCYHGFPLENEDWAAVTADHQNKPIKLTLSKRGRDYTSSVELLGFTDADGNPYVRETEKYTSLRAPGVPAFNVDRAKKNFVEGEVLMNIDSFVINKVE